VDALVFIVCICKESVGGGVDEMTGLARWLLGSAQGPYVMASHPRLLIMVVVGQWQDVGTIPHRREEVMRRRRTTRNENEFLEELKGMFCG
jgi:hypothetical protein